MIADDDIFRRLAEGESLREICRKEKLAESTIRLRLSNDPELTARYARARDAQADHYAERIVDEALESRDASIGRLRMDALKWAASKLAPKRYGDKQQLEHAGPDGGPIEIREVRRTIVDPANPDRAGVPPAAPARPL